MWVSATQSYIVSDGLVGYFPWCAMGRICRLYSTDITQLYTTSFRSQLHGASFNCPNQLLLTAHIYDYIVIGRAHRLLWNALIMTGRYMGAAPGLSTHSGGSKLGYTHAALRSGCESLSTITGLHCEGCISARAGGRTPTVIGPRKCLVIH